MSEKAAKQPLAWGLVALALLSLGLGGGAAAAAGYGQNALAPGLASLLVVVTALVSPREILWKAGAIAGAGTFSMLMLVYATAGHPLAAGVAMALVAFFGAMLAAGGSALGLGGVLLSMAYFMPAATSSTKGLGLGQAAELGLIGVAAGLIAIAIIVGARALKGSPPNGPDEPSTPAEQKTPPLEAIRTALMQRDDTFRYALRRALALGVAMGIFQISDNHNVFWIMLTMFIVLQPDRSSTWQKALQRSGGVIIGALAISGLSEVLPADAMIGLSVVVLIIGLLYFQRNYTVYAAGISFTVITLFGAQDATFTDWALLRVTDTVVGALIALMVGYLVLPDRAGRKRAA